MLLYKKLGFFESIGKYCSICKCRPKYKLYFNNEKTNWSYLCDNCLHSARGHRVPPEDMQEFVLKVKTVGMGMFEVV